MRRSRQSRFLAALIALFSLLFMQLAVAAYACPKVHPAQETAAAAMAHPADAESMPGCAGMGRDMEQPSLCHAHNQVGNHSLDKPSTPQVQPFAPAILAQVLLFVEPVFHTLPLPPRELVLQRVTDPPLSILNCCFRI
jgi:hypothetical protein